VKYCDWGFHSPADWIEMLKIDKKPKKIFYRGDHTLRNEIGMVTALGRFFQQQVGVKIKGEDARTYIFKKKGAAPKFLYGFEAVLF
jgi:hypothetical protein